MNEVSKRIQNDLIDIIKQDLDEYGVEINAFAYLNNPSINDFTEVRDKLSRFLKTLDQIIEDWPVK